MSGILYTDSLSAGYVRKAVVSGVEISAEKGRIVTLIGPNGCGKSTVLKSISAQLRPVAGIVFIDGSPAEELSERQLAKKLALVMTERIEPELMTCGDVVASGRYPYTGRLGILSSDDRRKADEAMELVRASELKDTDFGCISDGQRQRIMLARAICQEPEILILDEPTSFLDIRHKLELLSLLKMLVTEKNIAVIMSLHELDLAERISDTVVCIGGGKVDKVGTPSEIFRDGYINELYGIDEKLLTFARSQGLL